jgi:signal transduction histidine kinase
LHYFSLLKQKTNIGAKFAVAVTVFMLFGGLAGYYLQSNYEKIIQEKRERLNRVVSRLELRLDGAMMAVRMMAADADIGSLDPEQARPELINAVKTLGLQNAALFNVDGNLIVDANGMHPWQMRDVVSFETARAGKPVISNRIVPGKLSDAYVSLRVPVYGKSREVNAVLAAAIPTSDLAVIVLQEGLTEGQHIAIEDAAGQFIYHPQIEQSDPEDTSLSKNTVALEQVQTEPVIKRGKVDDIKRIYIYQPVEQTFWRVSISAPLSSVYGELLKRIAPHTFTALLLIAVILLLWRYVRHVDRYRRMMEELRIERLSVASEMAAGIAHEVRNPLTSIKGFIQLMLQKQEAVSFKNYLEIILGEIERIDALINEFQTLARPMRPPKLERSDLGRAVYDVVMLMEGQAGNKNVHLEYTVQEDLFRAPGFWARIDVPQIKQVFINLLKNAFDAVGTGGKVTVTLTWQQEMVAVSVRDDGGGISPDMLKKLGTPFLTTKEGGTGLGLSVCYTIIHNHGGRIDVSSQLGEGTTFTVLLPPDQQD